MGVPCTSTDGDSYFAAVAESYDRLQPVPSPPYENGLGMIVDLIPGMLSIARKKLASHAGRAEACEADMTRCEIPECDVVLSAKAIHCDAPSPRGSPRRRRSSSGGTTSGG